MRGRDVGGGGGRARSLRAASRAAECLER